MSDYEQEDVVEVVNMAITADQLEAILKKVKSIDPVTQLRQYDGTSDAKDYLSRLNADLIEHGINEEWMVRNFDKLLSGDAKDWWDAKYRFIQNEIGREEGKSYAELWTELKAEMIIYFDHSSQTAIYRKQNKKLVYNLGDDPQCYVSSKLQILSKLDANMSEGAKVRQVKKGLPKSLQEQLSLISITNVHHLLSILRNRSEVDAEFEHVEQPSRPLPSQGSNSYQNNSYAVANNESQRSFPNMQSSSFGPRTDDGRPICMYCGIPGHIGKFCRKKESDKRRDNYLESRPPRGQEPISRSMNNSGNYPQNSNGQSYQDNRPQNNNPNYPYSKEFSRPENLNDQSRSNDNRPPPPTQPETQISPPQPKANLRTMHEEPSNEYNAPSNSNQKN